MTAPEFVEVYVLPTGYLWLPDRWIFADGDPQLRHLSPDYSFLICHPSGKNVLFDLGMRKVSDPQAYQFLLARTYSDTSTTRISRTIQGSLGRIIP